jgi:hypothetical protein
VRRLGPRRRRRAAGTGVDLIDTRTGTLSPGTLRQWPVGWRDSGHFLAATTDREANPKHILQVVSLTGEVSAQFPS